MIHRLDSQVDLLELHAHKPERYPCMLQSSAFNTVTGRYDILFAFPQSALILQDQKTLFLDPAGEQQPLSQGFLTEFDNWFEETARKQEGIRETALPFTGGWCVYLGYELANQIEPSLPRLALLDEDWPDAMALRIPAAFIHDRFERCQYIVTEHGFADLRDQMLDDWRNIGRLQPSADSPMQSATADLRVHEDEPEPYLRGVEKIREYIREGDVFQVNFSRGWQVEWPFPDLRGIFRAMSACNPAPFSAILRYQDRIIASMSPERLISVSRDGVMETRPIAGTRPRGLTIEADQELARELLNHHKELAEHVMLVDLERNDLGRIAIPGSISVPEMMTLESYASVHHIVSNVTGMVRPEVRPSQILASVFPGGTITGCPKVRCMEIINELEQIRRQAYTGSMGYINHDGSMDLNILIRTLQYDRAGLRFRTGAGIVHDSIPEAELAETCAKADGILRVLRSTGLA
ncbi:MAG: aminodeoxychorismate synthase component I [Gammaproteobacteria bacterium]|nr:MAG: aminodeoxychorismate synthase component I [Gammaproteobacteria bacterium]